jgi:hypothetical protein
MPLSAEDPLHGMDPVHGIGRFRWLAHRRTMSAARLVAVPAVSTSAAPEIDALLTLTDTDRRDFARRLSSRLQPLVQRGVPPRVIEAAPAPRAARLRFADGTTILVKVAVPGQLGTLALTMRHGSLKPAGWRTDPDGSAHLLLSSSAEDRCLSLHVVGLDQPD